MEILFSNFKDRKRQCDIGHRHIIKLFMKYFVSIIRPQDSFSYNEIKKILINFNSHSTENHICV